MGVRYEFKGQAKAYVAVAMVIVAAWTFFGQTLFSFNLSYFSQGYQVSFFRGGHFERHGIHTHQQNAKLGRIVSTGGEVLEVYLSARVSRGSLVLFAWRWPAFLYSQPMLHRSRYVEDTETRLQIALPGPGVYVLSVSPLYVTGDFTVDWRVVPR